MRYQRLIKIHFHAALFHSFSSFGMSSKFVLLLFVHCQQMIQGSLLAIAPAQLHCLQQTTIDWSQIFIKVLNKKPQWIKRKAHELFIDL